MFNFTKTNDSKAYFNGLNYTLANEDSLFELALARHYQAKKILTVCGSGGRSLPFLSLAPETLTLVDLSGVQLDLARLKEATLRQLDFTSYCLFWGFPPFSPEENRTYRRQLFNKLDLPNELRESFDELFRSNQDEGLIYKGKWEKRYMVVPTALRSILGTRLTRYYDQLFEYKDLRSQQKFVEASLANPLWKALPRSVVFAFGNAHYFNAFLYKGAMMIKNLPESSFEFYRQSFRYILKETLARENFFLQLSFFGKLVYPEANPPEAQLEVFAASKSARPNVALSFLKGPVIPTEGAHLDKLLSHGPYDFVSLSDVPSYLKGKDEVDFLQKLRSVLAPGAIVISRCYLRVPENTDLTGFVDVTNQWQEQIAAEKTQMYKIFVYRYNPPADFSGAR